MFLILFHKDISKKYTEWVAMCEYLLNVIAL